MYWPKLHFKKGNIEPVHTHANYYWIFQATRRQINPNMYPLLANIFPSFGDISTHIIEADITAVGASVFTKNKPEEVLKLQEVRKLHH